LGKGQVKQEGAQVQQEDVQIQKKGSHPQKNCSKSMQSAQVQKKWNEVQKSVVRTILYPFDLVSIPLEIGELNSIPLVRGPITETE